MPSRRSIIRGAVAAGTAGALGGLLLGIIEMNGQWYFGSQVRELAAYFLLFACLVLRPGGLLGDAPARVTAAYGPRA